jgi:hypothetical protein
MFESYRSIFDKLVLPNSSSVPRMILSMPRSLAIRSISFNTFEPIPCFCNSGFTMIGCSSHVMFPYIGRKPIHPANSFSRIQPAYIYSTLQQSATSFSADSIVCHDVQVTDFAVSNNIRAACFFSSVELFDRSIHMLKFRNASFDDSLMRLSPSLYFFQNIVQLIFAYSSIAPE